MRVQVVIEEDGTPNPPVLPKGTITRIYREPEERAYCFVRLDEPVKCLRAETKTIWTLLNLFIAPRHSGYKLLQLRGSLGTMRDTIIVNIGNATNMAPDDPLFDPEGLVYFGIGTISGTN